MPAEGEQFLDDVMEYFEDYNYEKYKMIQKLAKKYGDGSSFSIESEDIPEYINDFRDFPDEADVKFYTVSPEKETINKEPYLLYLGEAHIKIKFDKNWFRASEEERYENYAYESPIKDIAFKSVKIYDDDRIAKQFK